MRTGLVLGKFMPLHKGHIALIEFGLQHCTQLIVLLCATDKEPISGTLRMQWLQSTFGHNDRIQIILMQYNEELLPNTSVSSRSVSQQWAQYIKETLPLIDVIFTSEPYGDYMAEYLQIEHRSFDQQRRQFNVAASGILKAPFTHWDLIAPAAKTGFVKKICISGSESTGKSTLAESLARYFNTAFVPEMAREVIEKTEDVVYDDLLKIAALHAEEINRRTTNANKLLICDTDVNITRSYSRYLFNRPLQVARWIDEANSFHLHIFLDTDCPFVQDGTRLSEEERNTLSHFHQQQLKERNISYYTIGGNWQQRFEAAKTLIEATFFKET
ncbi:MAG: AAA family ATPase [Chitinophagaceae bacterium]